MARASSRGLLKLGQRLTIVYVASFEASTDVELTAVSYARRAATSLGKPVASLAL
jgi:hypothetical protein